MHSSWICVQKILGIMYIFHFKLPQCPVGLLLLRYQRDQQFSIKTRPLQLFRPVTFTLDLRENKTSTNALQLLFSRIVSYQIKLLHVSGSDKHTYIWYILYLTYIIISQMADNVLLHFRLILHLKHNEHNNFDIFIKNLLVLLQCSWLPWSQR